MAYTQADADALKGAISNGAKSVMQGGEMIVFRSLAEMKQILRMMEAEISGSSALNQFGVSYPATSRGL